MKQTMKKYNLLGVALITISVLVLFFCQSVNEPAVYAKMKKMEEKDLSDIDAAALDIDMILNVRMVVSSGISLRESEAANVDSVNIGYFEIGNANLTGLNAAVNTSMAWDIGYSATTGRPYLLGGNFFFPAVNPGMGANFANVWFTDAATTLPIGNAMIKGLLLGQNVTGGAPNLDPFVGSSYRSPWVIITDRNDAADRQGIKAYGEMSAYVNEIAVAWRGSPTTGNTRVTGQGWYVYGMMNDVGSASNPRGWTSRTGMAKLGGTFPTYTTAGASSGTTDTFVVLDVGYNGTARGYKLSLDMPLQGSIRIKNVSFGTATWGPFALDDIVFYRNRLYLRDL